MQMAAEKSSTPTTFNFIRRQGRSEKVVAEVEIVFGEDTGVLSGMKLVGVCIWKSDKGLFVTFPARPGKGGRYFEYLRPATAGNGAAKALKEEVLRQWETIQAAAAAAVA
jgi:DNA-binding cell septation regulator SpoVG